MALSLLSLASAAAEGRVQEQRKGVRAAFKGFPKPYANVVNNNAMNKSEIRHI